MSNLFISEHGNLLTPALTRCGVAGVTREIVMQAAARHEASCRQEAISRARLLDAEEVLLVNSVIGAWQVKACAGRSWDPGTCAARVREWLDEE
jgi:4-amino-4-deoxychorismate lyase